MTAQELITPEDWGKLPEEQRKLWKETAYPYCDGGPIQMYQRAPLDTPVFKVGDRVIACWNCFGSGNIRRKYGHKVNCQICSGKGTIPLVALEPVPEPEPQSVEGESERFAFSEYPAAIINIPGDDDLSGDFDANAVLREACIKGWNAAAATLTQQLAETQAELDKLRKEKA